MMASRGRERGRERDCYRHVTLTHNRAKLMSVRKKEKWSRLEIRDEIRGEKAKKELVVGFIMSEPKQASEWEGGGGGGGGQGGSV